MYIFLKIKFIILHRPEYSLEALLLLSTPVPTQVRKYSKAAYSYYIFITHAFAAMNDLCRCSEWMEKI